jgi:hypothetical protein
MVDIDYELVFENPKTGKKLIAKHKFKGTYKSFIKVYEAQVKCLTSQGD